MRKTVLITAVTAALVAPSIAQACLNEVERTVSDYVKILAKAEKDLAEGRFADARTALRRNRFPKQLQDRAGDVKAVLAIRTNPAKGELESAAARFKEKAANSTDVRFKAWHAEAQIALGQNDDARATLVALKEADLMPDAFAIRALAVISTGTERYELYKACRTRAKNKDICELPKAKTSS
jgi:hypothetical protein